MLAVAWRIRMSVRPASFATQYVSTREAARLLGISARTLENYRSLGVGPIFRKLGGRVVYGVCDLEAWADQAACRSTSDPRYVAAQGSASPGRQASRPVDCKPGGIR